MIYLNVPTITYYNGGAMICPSSFPLHVPLGTTPRQAYKLAEWLGYNVRKGEWFGQAGNWRWKEAFATEEGWEWRNAPPPGASPDECP